METIALISLVTAAGYYLQDKTTKAQENIRNLTEKDTDITQMSELEKPNSLNIYNSDKVNASNDEVLKRALQNYKDAEQPAMTGVLPPIYNSYSSIGNENLLVQDPSSRDLAKIDDINRRNNILETPSKEIQDRPIFNLPNLGVFNNDSTFYIEDKPINQNISLLTGKPIERDHINMTPFFGSNIKQNVESFTNMSKLDHFTGNTSTFIHKQELNPFFDSMKQDISGTPLLTNNIDTSRFIPSSFRQGEKPFQEERIAAPISGTFDNPVDQNFSRNIDELRVANKAQISYEGRTKAGQMGSVRAPTTPVNKNRPDTYFKLGEERFFTSTGAIIADKSRENLQNLTPTSRQDQNIEYYGGQIAKDSLAPGPRLKIDNTDELDFSTLVQTPKRTQLEADSSRNIGSHVPSVNDFGKSSYNLPELERDTTNDRHTLNVNRSNSGQKVSLFDQPKITQKETLIGKRDNSGNIRRFIKKDNNTGMTNHIPKTTNKQTLIYKNYKGQANKKDQVAYTINKYTAKTTNKEITSNNPYQGNANSFKTQTVRTQYNNAEITDKKEKLLKGARPSGRKSTLGAISGGKTTIGDIKSTQNMLLKEQTNLRPEAPRISQIIPSKEIIGQQKHSFNKSSEVENTRMNFQSIQEQLSNNPYYNLR